MNVTGQSREVLFGRDAELARLRERLAAKEGFLLHGPAGVGKSALIRTAIVDLPHVLYVEETKAPQSLFRCIAGCLVAIGDRQMKARLKGGSTESKSALSLKGIVLDVLRKPSYTVVLDQLNRPSQAFAAAVREIVGTDTSVVSIARSAHMEDAGYVLPLYPFREEQVELQPFDSRIASAFASVYADRLGLAAGNRQEFLARVLEYAKGNPGVIVALLLKGTQAKYRAGDYIKIGPLYIDFRLEWNAIA